ncbi:MAG TPA: ribosome assembly factor SBDS [Candidatus Pacearchaeota archaeon]|nr:ribosome assembly factor SBDS [Candidatus Pacearchaeota archaeon]
MTQTIARIKQHGKHFEIMVDTDKALKFRKGESSGMDFLEIDTIFTDSKKGFTASNKDLEEAFGTTSVNLIAERIVKKGEVLLTHEHRDEEKEKKIKQVVDILSKMAVDPQTGNPHTPERIKNALEQAKVNIKNTPVDAQIKDIITEISKIIPLRIETKKVKITIPAQYTGSTYGLIKSYIENENWKNNGDLEVIAGIPSGTQIMNFYDKLNSITHGSAITEEIKENEK